MKIAGFTFIRNAVKLDFPVREAITSVLPLCDRFFIAVGQSEDETLALIRSIAPGKIQITETVWDSRLLSGGAVYAAETDKAFDSIPPGYDWCFYIQCDEVLHEKYLPVVRKSLEENLNRKEVEGLLFGFRHFFGTFDYTGDSRKWYRNEIRVIRNDKTIRSYRDAQGFRKNGRKLKVVPVAAEIYHYGWVRHPRIMQEKIHAVRKYYQGISEEEVGKKVAAEIFDYSGRYDALARFEGTHPAVMQDRISKLNWSITPDLRRTHMKPKYKILYRIEKWFGVRLFEYRNYIVV
ncbi:MAG TPA: hypothetical protein PKJ24_00930 [Prolixibacteraceae bacterium]|nr:hypothetical protein [Prolixibacteraceae bacterium]